VPADYVEPHRETATTWLTVDVAGGIAARSDQHAPIPCGGLTIEALLGESSWPTERVAHRIGPFATILAGGDERGANLAVEAGVSMLVAGKSMHDNLAKLVEVSIGGVHEFEHGSDRNGGVVRLTGFMTTTGMRTYKFFDMGAFVEYRPLYDDGMIHEVVVGLRISPATAAFVGILMIGDD
jgi:hypothetical protein